MRIAGADELRLGLGLWFVSMELSAPTATGSILFFTTRQQTKQSLEVTEQSHSMKLPKLCCWWWRLAHTEWKPECTTYIGQSLAAPLYCLWLGILLWTLESYTDPDLGGVPFERRSPVQHHWLPWSAMKWFLKHTLDFSLWHTVQSSSLSSHTGIQPLFLWTA